jgi:putative colanic acid biosynthesis UDP-glucose lipid carrier transferase
MQFENYLMVEDVLIMPIEKAEYNRRAFSGQRFFKRIIDILFSLSVVILIFSWLFPIIGLLIKMDSKGPIFFLQPRVGLKNKIFKCWKFRTMFIDSDSSRFKATERQDSRITKIGTFLRKTNLDELPQIINILLGDMSLVGPRPQAVPFYLEYKEFIQDLDLRHQVKPGLTGWAQIKGLRGDSPDENENRLRIWQRFECDVWYIQNWNLKLDIKILFSTFWIVINGDENAY